MSIPAPTRNLFPGERLPMGGVCFSREASGARALRALRSAADAVHDDTSDVWALRWIWMWELRPAAGWIAMVIQPNPQKDRCVAALNDATHAVQMLEIALGGGDRDKIRQARRVAWKRIVKATEIYIVWDKAFPQTTREASRDAA